MSDGSRCELDGNRRTVAERGDQHVVWHCGWCGQFSREEYLPEDARAYLQREWGDVE